MATSVNGAVKLRMGLTEWGMLVGLSVLWGGAFFFTGVAVEELPPLTIVVCRVGLAAIALWTVLILTGRCPPASWRLWGPFLVMGTLNNAIPFCLIVWGQQHIASSVASILNATTPLFTVMVAHACTADEKATTGKVIGVVIGFGGVAVMIGGGALAGLGGGGLPAQLAVLGAGISYSFAAVFGRRFARMGIDPTVTATGQVTASTLLLLPIMLVVDQPWTLPLPSLEALAAVAGLGLPSTALAYILFFGLLARAGATNLLIVTLLIPVSAALLGTAFLGEILAPRHLAGMAAIAVGLLFIDGRLRRKLR